MAERADVGAIRRAQIVEAASRVIARKGFHNATLAEVEAEAGISRGMMTYHFPTKEGMVLAVFDSLLDRLRPVVDLPAATPGRSRAERLIDALLVERPPDAEAQSLLHTFLAQIGHRDDYRSRLAFVLAALRDDLAAVFPTCADPSATASIILGAILGAWTQLQVEPSALEPSRLAAALKRSLSSLISPPSAH